MVLARPQGRAFLDFPRLFPADLLFLYFKYAWHIEKYPEAQAIARLVFNRFKVLFYTATG